MRRYLTDPTIVVLSTYLAIMIAECVQLRRTLTRLEARPMQVRDTSLDELVASAHATTTFN